MSRLPACFGYDEGMTGFTVEERAQLKSRLLEFAMRDPRLSGGAVTGSAAVGREDQWSDIDLAFGVKDPSLVSAVLSEFSDFMYAHGTLHHHDVSAGAWIYRVFFLPGGLQVDLAFVDQSEFRPLGPAFQLVFGDAKSLQPFPSPSPKDIIGLAWLHALHARSCIMRDKLWQAEYMVSAVRDYTLGLACIRLGLPSAHGRGVDSLPVAVTRPLQESMVGRLNSDELWRAFDVVLQSLTTEVNYADRVLGLRVAAEIRNLSAKPKAYVSLTSGA
jgi:hypothetical protein